MLRFRNSDADRISFVLSMSRTWYGYERSRLSWKFSNSRADFSAREPFIDQLDPMPNRHFRTRVQPTLDMRETADIRRRDYLRRTGFERLDFVGEQLLREFRLQE